jgi:tRNA G10  N-methylase Trm11
VIKSVSNKQDDILKAILELNGLESFDADLTYGNGMFYKNLPQPKFKFDIEPLGEDVIESCSTDVPAVDEAFQSVVFDPPFMTYVRSGRHGNGSMVMAKRFGGYWRYDELADHYKQTLAECHRILVKSGVLVFKCQDIVHNHKLQPTHINVVNWSQDLFRLKDLFILAANHRMAVPQQEGTAKKKQKHARIHHSYFLVLEKN